MHFQLALERSINTLTTVAMNCDRNLYALRFPSRQPYGNYANHPTLAFIATTEIKFILFVLVSVPPQKPVIYDARRRDRTKLIEPYNEGSDVTLICEVSGGWFAFFSHRCMAHML